MYYSQQKSRTHPGARPLGAASLDTAPPLIPQGPFPPPPQPPQGHTPIVNPFERRPKFPPLPADPRGPKWATRIPYYHRFPWHGQASAYVASTYQQAQAAPSPTASEYPAYDPELPVAPPRRSVWQSTLTGLGIGLGVTLLIWFLMFLVVSSVRPLTRAPVPSEPTFRTEPSPHIERHPPGQYHSKPAPAPQAPPAPQPKKSPDRTESHF